MRPICMVWIEGKRCANDGNDVYGGITVCRQHEPDLHMALDRRVRASRDADKEIAHLAEMAAGEKPRHDMDILYPIRHVHGGGLPTLGKDNR